MARIRTIKPEFPQSEDIGRLSRDARLLFIQLWTIADDCGKARASSRLLASLLYPFDDDAPMLLDCWLEELSHNNLVILYEVDGNHYVKIVSWLKHQKIDHPSKSTLPDPRESLSNAREIVANCREGSRHPRTGPRKKESNITTTSESITKILPSFEGGVGETSRAKPAPIPPDWLPSERDFEILAEHGVSRALAEGLVLPFENYWSERASDYPRDSRAKKSNWGKTFQNWCLAQRTRAGSINGHDIPAANNRNVYLDKESAKIAIDRYYDEQEKQDELKRVEEENSSPDHRIPKALPPRSKGPS